MDRARGIHRTARLPDHQALDLVVIGRVVGLSYLIGTPLVGAIVSSSGVNLLTPQTERGWEASRRRLFGATDPINHDLELAWGGPSSRRRWTDAHGR